MQHKHIKLTLALHTEAEMVRMVFEQPRSILAISSQPYVGYQHAALRASITESFTIETIGPQASANIHVGVMLDNMARWLYMENKRKQQKEASD